MKEKKITSLLDVYSSVLNESITSTVATGAALSMGPGAGDAVIKGSDMLTGDDSSEPEPTTESQIKKYVEMTLYEEMESNGIPREVQEKVANLVERALRAGQLDEGVLGSLGENLMTKINPIAMAGGAVKDLVSGSEPAA